MSLWRRRPKPLALPAKRTLMRLYVYDADEELIGVFVNSPHDSAAIWFEADEDLENEGP